jgi:DinB family protein
MTSAAPATTVPDASEFAPYYGRYISLVENGDVIRTLEKQIGDTVSLLSGVSEHQGDHRYAPDKWSVKQILGHLTDAERVFAYRALRIARADKTPIEGFEQDDYVRAGGFERRKLSDLVQEFAAVRKATVLLLRGIEPEAWLNRGVANNNEVSVRAIAYIIAGHELHHRSVLKEKYLAQA